MNEETTLDNKIAILAELWLNYRNDTEFVDFIEYNDLGLPLAYATHNKIVEITSLSKGFIEETFDLFVASLDIEDTGFESVEEMLDLAEDEGDLE